VLPHVTLVFKNSSGDSPVRTWPCTRQYFALFIVQSDHQLCLCLLHSFPWHLFLGTESTSSACVCFTLFHGTFSSGQSRFIGICMWVCTEGRMPLFCILLFSLKLHSGVFAVILCFLESASHCTVQVGLDICDPPASASQHWDVVVL
jgi:hypothetical protein